MPPCPTPQAKPVTAEASCFLHKNRRPISRAVSSNRPAVRQPYRMYTMPFSPMTGNRPSMTEWNSCSSTSAPRIKQMAPVHTAIRACRDRRMHRMVSATGAPKAISAVMAQHTMDKTGTGAIITKIPRFATPAPGCRLVWINLDGHLNIGPLYTPPVRLSIGRLRRRAACGCADAPPAAGCPAATTAAAERGRLPGACRPALSPASRMHAASSSAAISNAGRNPSRLSFIEKIPPAYADGILVGAGGFEPPKHYAADLQSVPIGHSGKLPYSLLCPAGCPPRECLLIIADTLRKCKPFFQIFLLFSAARFLRGAAATGHAPAGRAAKRRPRQSGAGARALRFCCAGGKLAKHRKIAKTGRWQGSQRPVLVRFCGKGTLGVRRQRGCPVLLPAHAGRAARRGGGQPPVWGWWYTKPPSSLSSV